MPPPIDDRVRIKNGAFDSSFLNCLRPKNDLNQISHYNIKGLLVREIMRIESVITQGTFY